MSFKKSFPLAFLAVLFYYFAFAGELASKQAVNYFNEGVRAQKKGDYSTADSSYRKALFVDPQNPDYRKFILNNSGVISLNQGDFRKAETLFLEALRIDPQYRAPLLNMGLLFEKKGDRANALECYIRAFSIEELKPKEFVLEEEQVKLKK